MNWFIIFFSLINLSVCIYEDQIGKFDWRQTYVGKIKYSQFDTVSTAKKIIVATEENVLAALNLKTGQIVWRHVLENASSGNIQLLHVSDRVVTVSGSNPYLIRTWDPNTGVLLWEWSLTLQNGASAHFSKWFVEHGTLVHMLPVFGSHIEVTMYNLMTGQNKGATSKLPATWINQGCILSSSYYSCVSSSKLLLSLSVTSNAVQIISKPLSNYIDSDKYIGNLRPLDGSSAVPGFIIDNTKVVIIKDDNFASLDVQVADQEASVAIIEGSLGKMILQLWNDKVKGLSLTANTLSGDAIPDIHFSGGEVQVPEPKFSSVMCTKSTKEQHVCRLLVTGGDDSVHLMQQGGRLLWSREEALANIVAVEFVDLPVSELEAAIESEFDQKEGSIWLSFTRRIHTQLQQLQTLIQSLNSGKHVTESDAPSLHRDYFNLHKILVLVTHVGKIFGMDNLSGEILWRYYEPYLDTEKVSIFTRRSARHPPMDAYLTVVGKHAETGNGLLISLNPIRGTLIGERTLHLDVQLKQAAVYMPKADNEKLHALVLLDADQSVQVLPLSSAPLIENLFIYVADKHTATVQGYALRYDGRIVVAEETWSAHLGGGGQSGHRIVALAAKYPGERVHSAGRVLGDRSVLYKYTNPNLLLFLTEGPDPLHKDVVVATILDAVSGVVVTSQCHRRARALPLAVHADNFFAYFYYNDKHRRTELATLELYEGKERWVNGGSSFSTDVVARQLLVERASSILPATPLATVATQTERSLTDKHLLVALSSGAIVEIPWAFVEPRRPITPTMEHREEGLLPYTPEVAYSSESIINYNKTVHRISSIYTAPSGLESTTLVLATGLDLFYTRVAPSKTFDLLKDDFDYYLIVIVLTALVVASYSTKYFASRKMLRMAWK